MAEEIKIRVVQEQQGDALQKAKKDADELKKSAGQGGAAPTAAQSENRRVFQEELRAKELRASGHKKEAEEIEKKLHIEQRSAQIAREQNVSRAEAVHLAEREYAVTKAKDAHGGMGLGRMAGDALDMATGQSGWVMRMQQLGNLQHILKAAPIVGGIALALGAVGGLFAARTGQRDKDIALQDKLREEGAASGIQMDRLGRFGSSSQAFGVQLEKEAELDALKQQHTTLIHRANSGVIGGLFKAAGSEFFTKGAGWYKPESARAIEENEAEQKRMAQEIKEADAKKQEWFKKVGKREIEINEALSHGRRLEARGIEDILTAKAEAKRLDEAGASPEEIERGVRAKMEGIARDRAQSYARLITARDGAADVARVATAAHGELGGMNNAVLIALREQRESHDQNHREAMGIAKTETLKKTFIR